MVTRFTWAELYALLLQEMPTHFEAEQLFKHVTGWGVSDLPYMGDMPAPIAQSLQLADLWDRRLAGEPLQYLLGEWEFYGLPFTVGEGVLIPRADTETLVDVALELMQDTPAPAVLDLCSGSGAVAVALAHSLPAAKVTAVELSDCAFFYLEKNIARNGVLVDAVRGDIHTYTPGGALNLLTANPPYIPSGDLESLQAEVHREPSLALDGGEDGLRFYRGILERYPAFLAQGGALCVEVGFDQAADVANLFGLAGLGDIAIYNDLSGIARVVTGLRV